jgi:hypothetical protein
MNGGDGDLSLNFTLLPQHLATLGYTCHMVGKVSKRRMLPSGDMSCAYARG